MATINNNNNRIYSYIIILLALFILVLFTKDQFGNIQISIDEKNIEQANLQAARDKVDKLNSIEAQYNTNPGLVEQYLVDFNESDFIEYIYSEIENGNMGDQNGIATVRSLSMKQGTKNEIGFTESNITLSIRVPSESRMREILDFFIKDDSKYKFFMESFNLPANVSDSGFNITIPLKVFYK